MDIKVNKMINRHTLKIAIFSLFTFTVLINNYSVFAEVLGKIAAVVEDDVILEQELNQEVATISQRIQASKTQMPPEYVLRKQVLEKDFVDENYFNSNIKNHNRQTQITNKHFVGNIITDTGIVY